MTKVLKYDCFHVTLKITSLLARKVALFYDTSLLIQHMSMLFIHVENEGYPKMMI